MGYFPVKIDHDLQQEMKSSEENDPMSCRICREWFEELKDKMERNIYSFQSQFLSLELKAHDKRWNEISCPDRRSQIWDRGWWKGQFTCSFVYLMILTERLAGRVASLIWASGGVFCVMEGLWPASLEPLPTGTCPPVPPTTHLLYLRLRFPWA